MDQLQSAGQCTSDMAGMRFSYSLAGIALQMGVAFSSFNVMLCYTLLQLC